LEATEHESKHGRERELMKQWILLLSLALLSGCNKPKHVSGAEFKREFDLRNAQTMVWSEYLGEKEGKVFMLRKTMPLVGSKWREEVWFTETNNLDSAFLEQLKRAAPNQASRAIGVPASVYTVKVLRHEKTYFADWGEIDGKRFENRYDAVVCEVLSGKKHVCDLAVYQDWFKKNRKDYPVVGSEITIKQFDFKEQMFNPVPGLYTIELDDFEILKIAPATK
jgi:hypothetical protein